MLQLHGYSGAASSDSIERLVGSPIEFQLDSATHNSEVELRLPERTGDVQADIKQTATIIPDSPVLSFSFGKSKDELAVTEQG